MINFQAPMRLLAWLVLVLVISLPAAAADTLPIGTLGASIPAEDLERRIFSNDLGKDQFIAMEGEGFIVFMQLFGLYDQRLAFEKRLDIFMAVIEAKMEHPALDPEVAFEDFGQFSRMTQRLKGSVSGNKIAYQLDLLSAGDGVGYLVLSWTGQTAFQRLQEKVDAVIAGLQLPGEGSPWLEKTTPSLHTYVFDDWTVDITFRDSIFAPNPSSKPGKRYSFEADEGQVVVHLFLIENDTEKEGLLDRILEAVDKDGTYQELTRSDLDLEDGAGLQTLLRSTDGEIQKDLAVAVIELGEDHWIDLRMLSSSAVGHRDELWDGLLQSLRVQRPEVVDAFPIVETKSEVKGSYFTEAARQLLEASRFLGQGPSTHAVKALPEGGFLLLESRTITRLAETIETIKPAETTEPAESTEGGPATEVLFDADGYLAGTLVPWGEKILFIGNDAEVRFLADGALEPTDFTAHWAAPLGEDLLLARNAKPLAFLGLEDLPPLSFAKLLIRDGATAQERLLMELQGEVVTAMAAGGEGRALVAVAALDGDEDEEGRRLLLVETVKGSSTDLGRWESVRRLEAAAGGWLVSGRPEGGRNGVYLWSSGGGASPLLQGEATGISLDDGQLTFITDRCLDPSTDYRSCIYRAPLTVVRQYGMGLWPFDTRLLNRIGARLQAADESCCAALPATREELSVLFTAADEAARELAGAPLPTAAEGVDSLLEGLSADRDLTGPGLLVATLVLTEGLLRRGAQWVPATGSSPAPPDYLGLQEENPFAIGLHPTGVLLTLLFEEDSWYTANSRITDLAKGRTIFLGADARAVGEKAREAVLEELPELLREGRTDHLKEVLAAQPDNLFLRSHVYRHLATHGHYRALVDLTAPYAARDEAEGRDVVAFFAGRLAAKLSPAEAAGIVQELRDAIQEAPAEQGLYLLLGAAYERTSDESSRTLARACYRKAVDLRQWTDVGKAAEKALERIDDET